MTNKALLTKDYNKEIMNKLSAYDKADNAIGSLSEAIRLLTELAENQSLEITALKLAVLSLQEQLNEVKK